MERKRCNVTRSVSMICHGLMGLMIASMMVACAPARPDAGSSQPSLSAGYRALESKQFGQAMSIADAYLRQTPTGSGSAEAFYLRGRALSERPATSVNEAQSNLSAARGAYEQALRLKPSDQLEAYIRTSLANAAYFQDDFVTAADQWAQAYRGLEKRDLKAWVLYRMGRAQQRMGQFEQADRTLARVQQDYPKTQQAQLAREAMGARQFMVQLATFSSQASADRAATELRRGGVQPTVNANSTGKFVLSVGPASTYLQARALRDRFTSAYPDALIVP